MFIAIAIVKETIKLFSYIMPIQEFKNLNLTHVIHVYSSFSCCNIVFPQIFDKVKNNWFKEHQQQEHEILMQKILSRFRSSEQKNSFEDVRWELLVGIDIQNEGQVRGLNVVYLLMLHYTEYITGERSRECSARREGRTLVQFKGSRVSSKCCVLVYKPCM